MLIHSIDQMLRAALTEECRAEAEKHGWSKSLWKAFEQLEISALLLPEAMGGFGGSMEDACAVARLMGRHAVPAPAMETILAAGFLAEKQMQMPALLACGTVEEAAGGRINAFVPNVPWGRFLDNVLVVAQGRLLLLSTSDAQVSPARNLAGEPRDGFRFTAVLPVAELGEDSRARTCLIAVKVSQMAGALEAALDLAISYANQRIQFGKPIGKFQALQHQLAIMAEEVAAATAAAGQVARAAAFGPAEFEAAAAKLRANRAADASVPILHQAFGAIGFTQEHSLHRYTQRLLSWRSEQGGDRLCSEWLGQAVISRGASALWADLTARADALEGVK